MMFLWPFFLFVGVAMLVLWVVRGGTGPLPMPGCMGHGSMDHGAQDKTPLEIVRERYARGELTKEQFEEISPALTL